MYEYFQCVEFRVKSQYKSGVLECHFYGVSVNYVNYGYSLHLWRMRRRSGRREVIVVCCMILHATIRLPRGWKWIASGGAQCGCGLKGPYVPATPLFSCVWCVGMFWLVLCAVRLLFPVAAAAGGCGLKLTYWKELAGALKAHGCSSGVSEDS